MHTNVEVIPNEDRKSSPAAGMTAMWFAWAALLTAAMVLGNFGGGHAAAEATAARMASSIALVVTAWLAHARWRQPPLGPFSLLIAIGMTCGALGDFFNAGLLGFIPLPDPVLGGIAAFALGHIAYIAGCLYLAGVVGATHPRPLIGAIVAWQLIGVVGWYVIALLGSENRDLVWPALPYTLLLAGTAGVTSGIAIQHRGWMGLAVGGALFLLSDLILACGLFRGGVPYQTELVWLTYGPAQMLIVFTAASINVMVGLRIVARARDEAVAVANGRARVQ